MPAPAKAKIHYAGLDLPEGAPSVGTRYVIYDGVAYWLEKGSLITCAVFRNDTVDWAYTGDVDYPQQIDGYQEIMSALTYEGHEVNLELIAQRLRQAGIPDVEVAQTGGGTATILVLDQQYGLGPGWFAEPGSREGRAHTIDLCYGDYEGEDYEMVDPRLREPEIANIFLAYLATNHLANETKAPLEQDFGALKFVERLGLNTSTAPPEMAKNVGRVIRFKNWKEGDGTLRRDYSFTIIGTQLNYEGRICYRVICNGYADTFGSVARPDDIEFVDSNPGHPDVCPDCNNPTVMNPQGFKVCATANCFLRDTRLTDG